MILGASVLIPASLGSPAKFSRSEFDAKSIANADLIP